MPCCPNYILIIPLRNTIGQILSHLLQRWDETLDSVGKNDVSDEIEYYKIDKGEYMGFIRLVATKKCN